MIIERGLVATRLGHIHYRAAGSGPPILLFHIKRHAVLPGGRFCMTWERAGDIVIHARPFLLA